MSSVVVDFAPTAMLSIADIVTLTANRSFGGRDVLQSGFDESCWHLHHPGH